MRRIVVTGCGVISSVGIGKDAFWDSLVKGRSGIGKILILMQEILIPELPVK